MKSFCRTGTEKDVCKGFGQRHASEARESFEKNTESESEVENNSNSFSFFSDEEGEESPPTSSQSYLNDEESYKYTFGPFKSKFRQTNKIGKSGKSQSKQMTLDLGQKMRIDCYKCGMSYDRTDAKDKQMHFRYHSTITLGLEWCPRNSDKYGKLLGEHTLKNSSIDTFFAQQKRLNETHNQNFGFKKSSNPDMKKDGKTVHFFAFDIRAIAQQDRSMLEILQSIQDAMDSALGAVPIRLDAQTDYGKSNREKLIVAVWHDRVVGSALVSDLPASVKVYRIRSEMENAVMINANESLESETVPLAVHRIYVLSCLRRSGIASAILDAALNDCVYGLDMRGVIHTIGRGFKSNTTAFSQPTESGRLLAERWIEEEGRKQGVLVFEDAS